MGTMDPARGLFSDGGPPNQVRDGLNCQPIDRDHKPEQNIREVYYAGIR